MFSIVFGEAPQWKGFPSYSLKVRRLKRISAAAHDTISRESGIASTILSPLSNLQPYNYKLYTYLWAICNHIDDKATR
ncbi:MAG: hypothetical protein IK027_04390, partial [Deltaproteobacteria bacterium]|nr:hypothetical protein [Deltaproteobacteria bacterium]